MSEPITLDLIEPIELEDEKITRLEFTKLKAKHLKGLKADPTFDDLLGLVGKSTGLLPKIIGELSIEDAMRAVEVISGFFGSGRTSGDPT